MIPDLNGVTISYESPGGDVWTLISPGYGESRGRRIVLKDDGVEGFTGRVEREDSESVSPYGARPSGWRLPPLEMSISYWARSQDGPVEAVLREWRQSWEGEEPGDFHDVGHVFRRGKVWVHTRSGEGFWTPVSSPEFPDIPSGASRLRVVEESVSFRSMIGHWFGQESWHEGDFDLIPLGNRPLSPRLKLVWDGSATSVTFPSGLTVHFPDIGVERHINLDRGMSGQVTRPDGSVDTGGWSSLQGAVHGISLRPGVETSWSLGGGLSLVVTPRYLSPWG